MFRKFKVIIAAATIPRYVTIRVTLRGPSWN